MAPCHYVTIITAPSVGVGPAPPPLGGNIPERDISVLLRSDIAKVAELVATNGIQMAPWLSRAHWRSSSAIPEEPSPHESNFQTPQGGAQLLALAQRPSSRGGWRPARVLRSRKDLEKGPIENDWEIGDLCKGTNANSTHCTNKRSGENFLWKSLNRKIIFWKFNNFLDTVMLTSIIQHFSAYTPLKNNPTLQPKLLYYPQYYR